MLVLKKVARQVQVSSPRISKPAMTAGRSTCGPTEMLPPPILLVTRPCPGEAFASEADSSDVSAAAEATEPAAVVRRLRGIGDFIAAYEAEHGEITEEEMEAAVRRARERAIVVRDGKVVCLAQDGDDILTSDPRDLLDLVRTAGVHVELIPV